jgi:hypothetical protein
MRFQVLTVTMTVALDGGVYLANHCVRQNEEPSVCTTIAAGMCAVTNSAWCQQEGAFKRHVTWHVIRVEGVVGRVK